VNGIVIGYGSIGRRHTKNLISLGCNIRTVDIDEIDNIDSILQNGNYDFGFVCTPSNLHLEHTLKLAENGIHFFCEKPFYTKKDLEIINKIRKFIYEKSLTNMVGCNLRFHPTLMYNKPNSNIDYIKVFFGYDLKKWHNDGKHLELYSANKSMGGGVLMDVIHEFDYLYHWFGNIKNVEIKLDRIGDVTIDTEDTVDAVIEFDNGIKSDIHLDYLQEDYTRYFEYGGERYDIEPDDEI
jgi:predicted dehydrogenase